VLGTRASGLLSEPTAGGLDCHCEKCHGGKDRANQDGRGGPVHPAWPTVKVTISEMVEAA
jgi:hypothetical protein